jgi:hypothetical protein
MKISEISEEWNVLYYSIPLEPCNKININFYEKESKLISGNSEFEVLNISYLNDTTILVVVICTNEDYVAGEDDSSRIYELKFKVVLNQTTSKIEIYSDAFDNLVTKNIRIDFAHIIMEHLVFIGL